MWDDDFKAWLQRFSGQLRGLLHQGADDKLQSLFVYAFTQIHQSHRTEFIEYLQQNFATMKTSGDSIYDSLINEGMEKGMERGREAALRAMVRNMLENGMSPEEIIRVSGLEPSEFKRLREGE